MVSTSARKTGRQAKMVRKNVVTTLVVLTIVLSTITSTSTTNAASAQQIDVPLNQALVLEGGESTNPRQYDPHTTYGSGDKRVFSGLVALDRKSVCRERVCYPV